MIFMVNDKRIEIYIHEVGKKTKIPCIRDITAKYHQKSNILKQ